MSKFKQEYLNQPIEISMVDRLVIEFIYLTEKFDKDIGCPYNKEFKCYVPETYYQRDRSNEHAEILNRKLLKECKKYDKFISIKKIRSLKRKYEKYSLEELEKMYEVYKIKKPIYGFD